MRKPRGNVHQRSDGRWEGRVTISDPGHPQRRLSVYGRTRQEALEKVAAVRVAKQTGSLVEPSRQTVGAYLTRWLTDSCRPAVREATYTLYALMVRKHISPRLGSTLLSRLTPAHVQGLLAGLDRAGVSARTRQMVFQVLRRALQQALAWNLIVRNPAAACSRPRVPRKEMQVLTPDQARRFLTAAQGDRLHALYTVLLGCGLRLGEALGLAWPDVDLTQGYLTVRRQLCEVSGRLWLQEPKTTTALRRVDLPGFVVMALREHHTRMETEGHLLTDHLLVFVDRDGGFIRKSNLRRRSWAPLLRTAGIPYLRLHDLRHSAATLMLLQGVHPKVVQERLGHATVAITLGLYSHVLPTMGKDAAAKMDDLLKPQP